MPIIIILTGSGGNKYGTITRWTTKFLHERKYNLFLIDTRGQGYSSGIKTFGIGEAVDLIQIVNYLSERFPNKKIGAVGFSLGAATILRAAGINNRLSAVVAYASYADIDYDLINRELYAQGYAIRRHLCQKNKKFAQECRELADFTGQVVKFILSPVLIHLSLKLWSFTLLPIPSPKESVTNFGERALLLMHNNGDPEILVSNARELFTATDTSNKSLKIIPYKHHHPPFTANPNVNKKTKEKFRTFFKKKIQIFFDTYLTGQQ